MKVKVDRSALESALSLAVQITDKRSSMPVLANVLLRADNTGLTIAATDLQITQLTTIDLERVEVFATGSVTLSARSLHDIVKSVRDDVTIEYVEGVVNVRAGKSSFTVATLPERDFPKLPEFDAKYTAISAGQFSEALSRVGFAASHDTLTRQNLCGVHVVGDGIVLKASACDGHRLSQFSFACDWKQKGVLLSTGGVSHLIRALEHADVVEVAVNGSRFLARVGSCSLSLTLVTGEFPGIDHIVDRTLDLTVDIPRKSLLESYKRVGLLVDHEFKKTSLTVLPGKIELRSKSDRGEAVDEFVVEYNGPLVRMGLSSSYMSDMLKVTSGDVVTLSFVDELTPPIFADGAHRCVVMPMRL